MPTLTAWRFSGTEGAENAILGLQRLDDADLIEVQDAAVVRWPPYAARPLANEHVTAESSKLNSLVGKLKHAVIDSSVIESVKGDIHPGDSALVLLSSDAVMDVVTRAFRGLDMELIRSDLTVQQQDLLRAALSDRAPGW